VTIDEPEGGDVDIQQLQLSSPPEQKFHALCWLLHEYPHDSALIFCNFKATVTELAEKFVKAGVSADRLDGDLDQFQRDQVLARFRNQSVRLLIATDIAGRGIDVEDLDLIINFDLPHQPEVYVHRIGRTGRAGKTGAAISLTMGGGDSRIDAIEQLTGTVIETVPRRAGDDPGIDALLRSLSKSAKMETILISGGRKDKLRPGDILGALTGEAGGLQGTEIGKIEVHDRLSYVAVAQSVCRTAVDRLNAGRIKRKRFRATLVGRSPRRARPSKSS
jgi:ATP-independent RNA helicase DbpA